LNEAIALCKETRPKLVISHTAPSEGVKEILKGLNGSYFMNKHGDVESRTGVARNVRGPSAIRLVSRTFSYQSRISNWRYEIPLLGGDGRIRGRVVRFECRMVPCEEPGADQENSTKMVHKVACAIGLESSQRRAPRPKPSFTVQVELLVVLIRSENYKFDKLRGANPFKRQEVSRSAKVPRKKHSWPRWYTGLLGIGGISG